LKRFTFLLIIFTFLSAVVWGQVITIPDRHLVFGPTATAITTFTDSTGTTYTLAGNDYQYQDFSALTGTSSFEVTGAHNIYFLNAGTNAVGLTLTVEDGFIEFKDNLSLSSVTLNASTGSINLVGADIELTGSGNNFIANTKVNLKGTASSITVDNANIELGNGSAAEQGIYGGGINLTLEGNSITLRGGTAILQNDMNVSPPAGTNIGALNITGNAVFPNVAAYPASALTAASVSVSGNARLFGHISTGTGTQSYGSLQLDVADAANANVAYRYLAGSAVTISGALDCGGHDLRVNGNAVFNSNITNARRITVTGTTAIHGNINVSANGNNALDGNLIFTGAVALENDVTITGRGTTTTGTGSTITFGSTVNGAHALTIANANAEFKGAVGGTIHLTSLSVAGTTEINAAITTDGFQTYTGNATLGAALSLGAGGAGITFTGTVNGPYNLTIAGGNVAFNSTVGNTAPLTGLTVTSGTAAVSNTLTVNGNLVLNGAATVNGGASTVNGNITLNGLTLAAAASIRLSNGTWTNTGTTNNINGTVIFEDAVVNGDNTFYNVTCIGTVRFEHDKTQEINNNFHAEGAILTATAVTPQTHWELITPVTNPANLRIHTNIATEISWCKSNRELGLVHAGNATDREDNEKVFYYDHYVWTGAGTTNNTSWNNLNNWLPRIVPDISKKIKIPPTVNILTLTADEECEGIEIDDGGIIDLRGFTLTIAGTEFINEGTIRLYGVVGQIDAIVPLPDTGTIHYHNTSATVTGHWVFGNNYTNLIIDNNITMEELTGTLNVDEIARIGLAAGQKISTTGSQNYGSLILTSALVLEGTHVEIGALSGNFGLTINGHLPSNADARFTGSGGSVGTIIVNGHSTISTSITTTGAAGQAYHGAVTLGAGGAVLDATNAAYPIILGSLSGNNSLTIEHGAVTFAGTSAQIGAVVIENGSADFTTGLFNAASVEVNGASTLRANITTSGSQIYNGVVTLDNDITLTETNTSSSVVLGAVTGGGNNLTITGNAEFNTVSGVAELTVTGTAAINANITTTGDQTYNAIDFGNVTHVLTGTNITANGAVSGTAGFTANASQNITMNNAGNDIDTSETNSLITLNISTGLTPYDIIFGTGGDISLNAVNNSTDGTITISRSGALTIDSISGGSISLGTSATADRVGVITQTGGITTESLTIYSSAAITLNEPANAVKSITIANAGGASAFNSTGDLSIDGIANVGNYPVTIIATGNITVGGEINTSGANAVVEIESEKDITINSAITANRLLLTGDVIYIEADITITGGNQQTHEDAPADDDDTNDIYAMHIHAGTLTGQSDIHLIAANAEICAFISDEISYKKNQVIGGSAVKIHYHTPADRHIVYKPGAKSASRPSDLAINNYFYIRADDYEVYDGDVIFKTSGNGNVYIIDIENTQNAGDLQNTRNVSFSTANGSIIIRGEYYSTGTLDLSAGTAGAIRLQNANIELAGTDSSFNLDSNIILEDDIDVAGLNYNNSIKADTIALSGITGASNYSLSLDGNIILKTGNYNLDTLEINNGTFALDGSAGDVNITSSNVKLNTINEAISVTGIVNVLSGTIDFNNSNYSINITDETSVLDFSGGTAAVFTNTDTKITFSALDGGLLHLGSINPVNLEFDFNGGTPAAPLFVDRDNTILNNDVTILSGYVKVVSGREIEQDTGRKLELKANDPITTLDITEGEWTTPGDYILNGTSSKISSRLVIDENTSTWISNGNFTSNGWGYIQTKDTANPLEIEIDLQPQLILEINSGVIGQRLETIGPLGSLHIVSGTVELQNDLEIYGELVIDHTNGGVLDAGSNNITMYAGIDGYRNLTDFSHSGTPSNNMRYGRWEIRGTGTILPNESMNNFAFKQDPNASVTFARDASDLNGKPVFFEIVGNTIWQDFICIEPGGATLQFSTGERHNNIFNRHHHIFYGKFEVKGTHTGHITLTRYVDPDDSVMSKWVGKYNGTLPPGIYNGSETDGLPKYPASTNLKGENSENMKFWNFNLMNQPYPNPPKFNSSDISFINVFFSHAWYQRIPLRETVGIILEPYYKHGNTPSTRNGYFNYEWGLKFYTIIYSYAEDFNGNGKADRIRVQTNINSNKDFSKFVVVVEIDGKNVTYDGSNTGIFEVLNTGDPEDENSFYINIDESSSIYDGKPITWKVVSNESLKDVVTGELPIGSVSGDFDTVYKTINTIPPRISYALTLPDHKEKETFFQFSQPVKDEGSKDIGGNRNISVPVETVDRSASGIEVLQYPGTPDVSDRKYNITVPSGALGLKFEINSQLSKEDLAALLPVGDSSGNPDHYFTAQGFEGLSVRTLDWRDPKIYAGILGAEDSYEYYPSPRYPKDWNYSSYETYSGNSHISSLTSDFDENLKDTIFIPPYKVLSPGMIRRLDEYAKGNTTVAKVTPSDFNSQTPQDLMRRSTDVLVSVPLSGAEDNYFAWPVWAKNGLDNNFEGESENINTPARIWDFNGSKNLEPRGNIDMEVNMNPLFSGDLEIFWANNIGVDYRNKRQAPTKGKNTGGLWQPDLTQLSPSEPEPQYNIAPRVVSVSSQAPAQPNQAGYGSLTFIPPLLLPDPDDPLKYTYQFDGSSFQSGQKLEFIFRIPSAAPDMFIACLDMPYGAAAIPRDWYRRVRPFSFDIQDLRLQRGGVIIMNNVINSDKREQTFLRYHLLRSGRVTIQVYTLDGSLVKSIRRNEQREKGEWTDSWDGTNNGGRPVARGMYFIRVVGPDIDEIRKVMVVK